MIGGDFAVMFDIINTESQPSKGSVRDGKASMKRTVAVEGILHHPEALSNPTPRNSYTAVKGNPKP